MVWPSIPKDANPTESQYAYFAREYMAAQAAQSVSEKKDKEEILFIIEVGVYRNIQACPSAFILM